MVVAAWVTGMRMAIQLLYLFNLSRATPTMDLIPIPISMDLKESYKFKGQQQEDLVADFLILTMLTINKDEISCFYSFT